MKFFLFLIFILVQHIALSQLKINEIMYAPDENEPEWIELYNDSDFEFKDSFFITNQNSSVKFPSSVLPPKVHIIITSDSSKLKLSRNIPSSAILIQGKLPSLHNSFDPLTFRNTDSVLIDSAYYDGSWGKKGFSLERKKLNLPATYKANFLVSLSRDSATAGYENSYSSLPEAKPIENGKLIINEVLYDEGDSTAEFIELYNRSSDDINLFECFVANKPSYVGHDTISIMNPKSIIKGGSYFLIVWDSLIFRQFPEILDRADEVYFAESNISLKISDEIYLFDSKNNFLDKLIYFDDWRIKDLEGIKNVSLERISPNMPSDAQDSWVYCGEPKGATPLTLNSCSRELSKKIELDAKPNPFSNINGYPEAGTAISYKLPFVSARVRLHIYTENGIEICRLVNRDYTSPNGEIKWDGRDENGNLLPSGPYIIWMQAIDIKSNETAEAKMLIVIGK